MPEDTKPVADFKAARDHLKTLRIILVIAPGEFVTYPDGKFCDAVYTEHLAEAYEAGLTMAEKADEELPPLGPTGSGKRKGLIYRHNRHIAAMRRLLGPGPS